MKRNINMSGRVFRAIVGIVFVFLYVLDPLEDNIINFGLLFIGGVLLIASIVQVCPLYYFLGINATKKTKKLNMY